MNIKTIIVLGIIQTLSAAEAPTPDDEIRAYFGGDTQKTQIMDNRLQNAKWAVYFRIHTHLIKQMMRPGNRVGYGCSFKKELDQYQNALSTILTLQKHSREKEPLPPEQLESARALLKQEGLLPSDTSNE